MFVCDSFFFQVDLAGSERVHKTQTGGHTLVEAKHINVSLFFLEMVIVALRERGGKGRQATLAPIYIYTQCILLIINGIFIYKPAACNGVWRVAVVQEGSRPR